MEALRQEVVAVTKAAHELPAPSDISYHRSLDPTFGQKLDVQSAKVLDLANRLLQLVETSSTKKGKKRKLREEDHVTNEDEFQRRVVDQVDHFLEGADKAIDRWNGLLVEQVSTSAATQATQPSVKPAGTMGRLPAHLLNAKTLKKPQLAFESNLLLERRATFVPLLKQKPHAITPLDLTPVQSDDSHHVVVPHPYETELAQTLKHVPRERIDPKKILAEPSPLAPQADSFETTPFLFVNTTDTFTYMMQHINKADEVAIDLEHHDYRSYLGLTCLVQISVHGHDFVVDVLVPAVRQRMVELNETFTNPKVVKVLHGADRDVIWLQRDFGLYIVGLFDTFQASKVLGYAQHSLASLLARFVAFTADKRYQLADWRIRPLPEEMLYYARSDTHYLLYIYHSLLRALAARDDAQEAITKVYEASATTAAQTFEFPTYEPLTGLGPSGWRGLVQKWGKASLYGIPPMPHPFSLSSEHAKTSLEFHVLRALHDWRDLVARDEDESTRFVLSNAALFKLAEQRPTDVASLVRTLTMGGAGSGNSLTPPVAQRKQELVDLIVRSIDQWDGLVEDVEPVATMTLPPPTVEAETQQLKVAPIHTVWDNEPDPVLQAPQSSLLSSASEQMIEQKDTDAALAKSTSSLFGHQRPTKTKSKQPDNAFQRILHQVHASLSAALSFSLMGSNAAADVPSANASSDEPKANHLYVPAAERTTTLISNVVSSEHVQPPAPSPVPTPDDKKQVVIVSSLAGPSEKKRKKKRKQTDDTPEASTSTSAEPSSSQKKRRTETAVPDKMATPAQPAKEEEVISILDRPSNVPAPTKNRDKKKKKKNAEPQLSFGSVPRDMASQSKGNRSATFY